MAFMRPATDYFTRAEAIEYACPSAQDTEHYTAGWYGRLSAPGYLDCTDWNGPFASEAEALQAVMDLYEVDENGDEIAV